MNESARTALMFGRWHSTSIKLFVLSKKYYGVFESPNFELPILMQEVHHGAHMSLKKGAGMMRRQHGERKNLKSKSSALNSTKTIDERDI